MPEEARDSVKQDVFNPRRYGSVGDGAEGDWVLYEKFKCGDMAAFHCLFDRHKNKIFNLSYRVVHDRELAEDIAQDVLIKVYAKKVHFRPDTKFSTWVYRVTVNASLDHVRKRRFLGFSLDQPTNSDEDTRPASDRISSLGATSPSEDLEKKELKLSVKIALDALPDNLRIPVLLSQIEDKSYQEVADILEISVKAVERRIYRAKEILRKTLKYSGEYPEFL